MCYELCNIKRGKKSRTDYGTFFDCYRLQFLLKSLLKKVNYNIKIVITDSDYINDALHWNSWNAELNYPLSIIIHYFNRVSYHFLLRCAREMMTCAAFCAAGSRLGSAL